jgi:hypothetical protein
MDKGGYTPHEPFRSPGLGGLPLFMLLKPALNHGLQMRLTHRLQAFNLVPERLPYPREAADTIGFAPP